MTHDDSTAYETKFGNGKVFGNEKLEVDGPEAEIKDNHNNKAPEEIKTQASDSNLENAVAGTEILLCEKGDGKIVFMHFI